MALGSLLILKWQCSRDVNGCFGASCLCQDFVFVGLLLSVIYYLEKREALADVPMQRLLSHVRLFGMDSTYA